MTSLKAENTAILIIDIQEKLLNAVFNKDILQKKAEIISKASNILNIPVFITEQYPQGLGITIPSIKENINTNTKFYEKVAFNALEDSNLKNSLCSQNIENIIICGIETHICVYQTASKLLSMDKNVIVVKDCTGSRCEKEYQSALDCMKTEGAQIKTAEMILFELLKTAKHLNFKEIQNLIK